MRTVLTKVLNQYTHQIYKKRKHIKGVGLINGKMGFCVNLYEIAKITGDDNLLEYADILLDEIYEKVDLYLSSSFGDGLAGIGWGIEHLVQRGFVQADVDSVLEEIDSRILRISKLCLPRNINLLKGLLGYCIYFLKKLENPTANDDNISTLIIKQRIIELIEQIDSVVSEKDFYREPLEGISFWNLHVLIIFLCKIHSHSLYNSRIEKIVNKLYVHLSSFIPDKYINKLSFIYQLKCLDQLRINEKFEIIYYKLLNQLYDDKEVLNKNEKVANKFQGAKMYYELTKLDDNSFFEKKSVEYINNLHKCLVSCLSSNRNFAEKVQTLGFLDGYNGIYTLPHFAKEINDFYFQNKLKSTVL